MINRIVPIVLLAYMQRNVLPVVNRLQVLEEHVISHLKNVIGTMIVSFVNVVEVH